MNGIVTALRNAVFFAAADTRPRQNGYAFGDSRHLTPHTSTHRPQPVHLLASTMGTHFALMVEPSPLAAPSYWTMMLPFIHGCGAHWKCTTPFWSNCLVNVAPGV